MRGNGTGWLAGILAITLLLGSAGTASGSISVVILDPDPDGVAGEPVLVNAQVASTSEVLSVQAAVGSRTAALSFPPGLNAWQGTLSLDGLPRGTYQLLVTATNSGGESAQAHVTEILFADDIDAALDESS